MGSARRGSNPLAVDLSKSHATFLQDAHGGGPAGAAMPTAALECDVVRLGGVVPVSDVYRKAVMNQCKVIAERGFESTDLWVMGPTR